MPAPRARVALAVVAVLCVVPLAFVFVAYRAKAQGPNPGASQGLASKLGATPHAILPMLGGFGGQMGGRAGAEERRPAVVHLVSPVSAKAAKTWEKLQAVVTLNFRNETPLEEFLKQVRQMTKGPNDKGVPFYVDPVGLQEAEKTLTSPITIDLDEVPLVTGLGLALKQLGLKFYVQTDGIVMIVAEADQDHVSEPLAMILDEISDLRSELEDIRKAVEATHRGPDNARQLADLLEHVEIIRRSLPASDAHKRSEPSAARPGGEKR